MSKNDKRRRLNPTYKQMTFETAVRNPDRYSGILAALYPFRNNILNDDKLLEIVTTFYLNGVVSSTGISIKETSTIESIVDDVVKVNKT